MRELGLIVSSLSCEGSFDGGQFFCALKSVYERTILTILSARCIVRPIFMNLDGLSHTWTSFFYKNLLPAGSLPHQFRNTNNSLKYLTSHLIYRRFVKCLSFQHSKTSLRYALVFINKMSNTYSALHLFHSKFWNCNGYIVQSGRTG